MKAIVIDDRPNVIDVLIDVLKINNVEVVGQGRNGKDAVDLYSKFKPDIVFLDVLMPLYDGFYGLEKIRKINPYSLIVFVTGDPMLEMKMKDRKIVPSAIVHKPFDVNKIGNVISSLKLTLSYSHDNIQQNLVKLCLERTLFEMGSTESNYILNQLKSTFDESFDDCIDHPENLKSILKQEFPNNYEILMDKMENSFSGFTSNKKISNFLIVLQS